MVPYRPIPPSGADYAMVLPPRGADGKYLTVNSNLNENQTTWYFRSAWNVAALNCLDAEHQPILDGYRAFLTQNARKLTATNNALDQQFRREHASRNEAVKAREAVMTQVYNYFALPPTRANYCNVALGIANEYLAAKPDDLAAFANSGLQRFEAVFDQFFREYEQYRLASADWDLRYGAMYGSSQPGYVAVHGAGGPTIATTLTTASSAELVGQVLDPDTGARIPLIAVPENTISTPIVQPVANPQTPSAN